MARPDGTIQAVTLITMRDLDLVHHAIPPNTPLAVDVTVRVDPKWVEVLTLGKSVKLIVDEEVA